MCRANKHLETNMMILHALEKAVQANPDLRFIQLLWAVNVVNTEDRFYEESEVTLDKIMKRLSEIR